MRILAAENDQGRNRVVARVEFPDGMTQTVILPLSGNVTRLRIISEAQRLRQEQEGRDRAHAVRSDLLG